MKKINDMKAITLIALIITIIVLLILAGITVAQLSGNGLFENTKMAKEKYRNAKDNEDYIIDEYSNEIDSYMDSNRYNTNSNQIYLTLKSPTTVETWLKVSDYPSGFTMDNTFMIGKIKGSDGYIRLMPYFDEEWKALLSIRNDGIYMWVQNNQANKDVYLLLIK